MCKLLVCGFGTWVAITSLHTSEQPIKLNCITTTLHVQHFFFWQVEAPPLKTTKNQRRKIPIKSTVNKSKHT